MDSFPRRMMSFLRSNAIALLALFVALGGTAAALQKNSVGTRELKRSAVKTAQLAPNAVKAPKLAPGAVGTPKLADGAVTGPKIANQAVTGPKIGPGQVTTSHLAAGAVTTAKLAPDALGAAAQFHSVPRRQIDAPSSQGTNTTVLYDKPPFNIEGRCTRGPASFVASSYVTSSQEAATQPIGTASPPTVVSLEPNVAEAMVPRIISTQSGTTNRRVVASVWAITTEGRYIQASVFIARFQEGDNVRCVFGLTAFAN